MGDLVKVSGGTRGPYKFDSDKQIAFLTKVAMGIPVVTACLEVGVTPRCVYNHRKNHPEFEDQMRIAAAQADDRVEKALFQKACTGDVIAAQIWLYNRRPGRWQDRRKVTVVTQEAVDSEIAALRARLEQIGAIESDELNGDDLR